MESRIHVQSLLTVAKTLPHPPSTFPPPRDLHRRRKPLSDLKEFISLSLSKHNSTYPTLGGREGEWRGKGRWGLHVNEMGFTNMYSLV